MNIVGKRAIVVGGASGMGKATAMMLKEQGAEVTIIDLPGSKGNEIAEKHGLHFHAGDVTSFIAFEETLREGIDRMGGLDILVSTAGGGIAKRLISKQGPHELEDFQKVLDLNVVSTFNICRLGAEAMVKNPGDEKGVMITTSSIAAFEGQIGQVAYSAAKAAISGMMLPMARDLGSLGIRVMAIAPSLFATAPTRGIPDEMVKELTRDAAWPKRMGEPDEYAHMARCIIENQMLNGQTIRLDAGIRFAPK